MNSRTLRLEELAVDGQQPILVVGLEGSWAGSAGGADQPESAFFTCWPQHAHLVHDIAVLADQRRRAAVDLASETIEAWNRYGLPNFLQRLSIRAAGCLNGEHRAWPGELRYNAYLAKPAVSDREAVPRADIESLGVELTPAPVPRPGRPQLSIIDGDGARIDPSTGEVFG